jgi:LCP family protein required for cell wall assembly
LISLVILILLGSYYFRNAHLFGEELVLFDQDHSYPTNTLATIPPLKTAGGPTPTLVPLCSSDQAIVYFLLIAKDYAPTNEHNSPEDYNVGFADAIRMVKVDFRDGSVSMVSIPRDLMVAVPALHSMGIYETRLKMVYAYGNEYDVPGGGASLLAQILYSNFGFKIDHYVILNFGAFVLGVESIGGIDVEIPREVGNYSAGTIHMNGSQALDYARLRDQAGEDTSDAARRERQTQVLFAIQKKVFVPEMLPMIPKMLSRLVQIVKTDLTSEQISQMICLAEKISTVENLEFSPDFYIREFDAFEKELLIPDYIMIREFVQVFQSP